MRCASHPVAEAKTAAGLPEFHATAQSASCLVGQIFQEERIHRALQPDVEVGDVALCERDDVHAGEGETLEESGRVFLVSAEAIQCLGEHDVKSPVQSIAHQRLESGTKQRGARDRVVGELLNDGPSLASRSVTSGGVSRSAATSRSNRSLAAWRARMRTRTLRRSSRRPLAMLRGAPCRAWRRLRFPRDRIITPQLLA
jgi:hypothetical protein